MKRETVPTSPQYKGKDKKQTPKKVKYFIGLPELLLIILLSLIGGICGSLIISNYPASWPYADKLIVRATDDRDVVYVSNGKKTDKEVILSEALQKIEPSVVSFFIKELDDDYTSNETLGSGMIITSDGWVVGLAADLSSVGDSSLAIVTHNNKTYYSEEIIIDDYSEAAFIKFKADNLTPVQFAETDNLAIGDDVVAVYNSLFSQQRAVSSTLENIWFHDQKQYHTQEHPADYLIVETLRKEYKGSPLINLQGEVLGLNVLDNRVIPHKYFTDVMPQVISNQKIQRIDLDLDYIDLSQVISSTEEQKGVQIQSLITLESGLLVNDVITKVDAQEIDKFHNFTHILQEYKPKDIANFTIIRKNNEQEIQVEL